MWVPMPAQPATRTLCVLESSSIAMTDQPQPVPRVAFLGLCDRADEVTHPHPALWRWNLIGLSPSRAFYVFPVDIGSLKLATAIYEPRQGEIFKLEFRDQAGRPCFHIEIHVEAVSKMELPGPGNREAAGEEGRSVPGWSFALTQSPGGLVVSAPGMYEVFLAGKQRDLRVGSLLLLHAQVPPFSREELAAIKSDPLASKLVRMEVVCKECGGAFKAYAGVERSRPLEEQGFVWNHDIQQDEFACGCGKNKISLAPIKTGLHGLLRRNVNQATAPGVSTERLYERTVLERSCRELLALVNGNVKEEDLQQFLELNPIFFHTFLPKKIFFKPRVLTRYVADFALVNERDELILIEIERASLRLLKKDGDATAALTHAFNQVRSWVGVFSDHRAAALDGLSLKLDEIAKVRGVVIAGRTPSDEGSRKVLRAFSTPEIELFTYDDLRRGVAELVRQVANV